MDLYNLVNNLFSSFFPIESPSKSAVPSQPSKSESVISELDQEIAALEEHYGALNNRTLTISLQELNAIIPRKRVRIDAYAKLTRHLKENSNATLIITSRKTHQ